jgi:hypothetical protein
VPDGSMLELILFWCIRGECAAFFMPEKACLGRDIEQIRVKSPDLPGFAILCLKAYEFLCMGFL